VWSLDELTRFLACPACKRQLARSDGHLACAACSYRFEVKDGVPVLLTDDSSHHASTAKDRLDRDIVYPLSPGLRKLRNRIAPPGPFWSPRRDRIENLLRPHLKGDGVVLHLGAKEAFLGARAVHIDLYPFSGVDVVTDAECMGIGSETVDCVYLPALLEHVPRPAAVITEVRRVLKPDGLILVEVPFLQGYHADPDDYQRFTLSGLRVLLDGFEEIDAGALAGPSSSLAWILRDWFAAWVPRHRLPRAHRASRILAGWATFWIRYADAFLIGAPESHELASGIYFAGRKLAQSA
jgi:uncharacterized protein YbaR (Trm112 family)/SAM-dependent methyltransferase